MFDRKVVLHTLEIINGSLSVITQRVVIIKSVDDFLLSNEGMMLCGLKKHAKATPSDKQKKLYRRTIEAVD